MPIGWSFNCDPSVGSHPPVRSRLATSRTQEFLRERSKLFRPRTRASDEVARVLRPAPIISDEGLF